MRSSQTRIQWEHKRGQSVRGRGGGGVVAVMELSMIVVSSVNDGGGTIPFWFGGPTLVGVAKCKGGR